MKLARAERPASRHPLRDDQASSRWSRIIYIGGGALLGILFAVIFFRQVDGREVVRRFGEMRGDLLVLGLTTYCIAFVLRALRFWLMLRMAGCKRLPFGATICPFIASFGISDLLPLRAGDAFRLLWFTRNLSVPASTTLSAMVVERLLDVLAIMVIGGFAFALGYDRLPEPLARPFGLALAFALLGLALVMLAPRVSRRLLRNETAAPPASRLLRATLEGFRTALAALMEIGSLRRMIGLLGLSLLCWFLEGLLFLSAWLSLGGALNELVAPSLAFVSSTLGTLVPSLPGHFGPFEYFGMEAFALAGVDRSFAAAVVLTAHLMLWAPTAVFAIIWLATRDHSGRRAPA
jgi:uncharacterized protein (TIRG00374 family)